MNGSIVVIFVAVIIYAVVYYAMDYCRKRQIENPVLTFRLWLAERKERSEE
jgi:hypothetical protein